MKKILYIIPILVFAMVAFTQEAKAQNESNAVTIITVNSVATNALIATAGNSGNNQGGGSTVSSGGTAQAQLPTVFTQATIIQILSLSTNISPPIFPATPLQLGGNDTIISLNNNSSVLQLSGLGFSMRIEALPKNF